MKTYPLVSAFIFLLRFVPVVRNTPWVVAHGSLDGALLAFAKASKAINHFAEKAEAEADKINSDLDAAEILACQLRSTQAFKRHEAQRARRVSGRIDEILN